MVQKPPRRTEEDHRNDKRAVKKLPQRNMDKWIDTYEQLMQMRISLDELEKKLDLVLDEIDELKESAEYKPRGNPEEQQIQQPLQSTKEPTYSKNSTSVPTVPKTLHRGFSKK